MRLGDKSLIPSESLIRLYPHRNLFSHIIGQIDEDNIGISGLEKSLDEKLKKNKDPICCSWYSAVEFRIILEIVSFWLCI